MKVAIVGSGAGIHEALRVLVRSHGWPEAKIQKFVEPIAETLIDFEKKLQALREDRPERRKNRKRSFTGHRRTYTHGKAWAQANRF